MTQSRSSTTRQTSSFRWVIIGLCYVTALLVHAIPTMSLSVLFEEISADLNLTLVQVGMIWGISSFTGMFIGLLGGMLGDKFGPNRILMVACFMIGIFGASRGLTTNFAMFLFSSFLLGMFVPMLGINLHRTASLWFSSEQLGLANGIIAAGFATGFTLGAVLGARFLSPLFGGWRNVFFVFGFVAFLMGLVWVFIGSKSDNHETLTSQTTFFAGLREVIGYREVLILGLGKMGFWGCFRGFAGYLPLYLRDSGWSNNSADNALALFFLVSLLAVIPLSNLSDKLQNRKLFIMLGGMAMGTAVIGMGLTTSMFLFGFIILGGLFYDTFMSIIITKASELKGLDSRLTGTAIGVVFVMADFSAFLSPIIGNWLARFGANVPFFFWGGIAILGLSAFYQLDEEKVIASR